MSKIGIVLGLFIGFSQGFSAENTKNIEWAKAMRGLEANLKDLMILSQGDWSKNVTQKEKLKQSAQSLLDHVKKLSKIEMSKFDADPSLFMISQLFNDDTAHLPYAISQGAQAYTNGQIHKIASYCVACHTRSQNGPQFASFKNDTRISKLHPLDRARFFTASREFDQALTEYENFITKEGKNTKAIFDVQSALRSALAIAIRVKNNSDLAMKFVDIGMKLDFLPGFAKENIKKWHQQVTEWKKEGTAQSKSENKLYSDALKLIKQAKSEQKFTIDRSADVYYLRASAKLHELLSLPERGENFANALYSLGLTYDALSGLTLWELQDSYFKACVYAAPHSDLSKECYERYEESVYQGYTGSSGVHLPNAVLSNLKELQKLTQPKTEIQK